VFTGQPDFVPIVGTQLLGRRTRPTTLITRSNNYYVLLAGNSALTGPGPSSPAMRCRPISEDPAAVARRGVAAIRGRHAAAQEAVIANTIPQTATQPLKNGPKFTPSSTACRSTQQVSARR
jgi:hypothetical protein